MATTKIKPIGEIVNKEIKTEIFYNAALACIIAPYFERPKGPDLFKGYSGSIYRLNVSLDPVTDLNLEAQVGKIQPNGEIDIVIKMGKWYEERNQLVLHIKVNIKTRKVLIKHSKVSVLNAKKILVAFYLTRVEDEGYAWMRRHNDFKKWKEYVYCRRENDA